MKKRWEVLEELFLENGFFIVAEIGVHTGKTASYLLSHIPEINEYVAVDPWEIYPGYQETLLPKCRRHDDFEKYFKEFVFKTKEYQDKLVVQRMKSSEAAKKYPDGYFDFIFIDGCHTYEFVKQDINCWWPKIRSGGVLGGHDYARFPIGNTRGMNVEGAVDEFFQNHDLNFEDNWIWWARR